MRTDGVIILSPGFHEVPGVRQRMEKMLVQKLIADFAVKALGKTILAGFARRDVVPLDAMILRPLQNNPACELSAVVATPSRPPRTTSTRSRGCARSATS